MDEKTRGSGGALVRAGSASCVSPFANEDELQAYLTEALTEVGCRVWREVKFLQPDYMTAGKTPRRSVDLFVFAPRGVASIPSRPDFSGGLTIAVAVKNSDACGAWGEVKAQAASIVAGYDYRPSSSAGPVLVRPWRGLVFTPAQLAPEKHGLKREPRNDDTGRGFDRERALWRIGCSFLWQTWSGFEFRAHVYGQDCVVRLGGDS